MNQFDNASVIPLAAIFDEKGTGPNPHWNPCPLFEAADIIQVVDVMSRREITVFGLDVLQEIERTGDERTLSTVRVALDREVTDEMHRLLAFVAMVKGEHDYFAINERNRRRPPITVEVCPAAAPLTCKVEYERWMRQFMSRAESYPDWRIGKTCRESIVKEGRKLAVCLDWRPGGYHFTVGFDENVIFEKV